MVEGSKLDALREGQRFPDWRELYKATPVEKLPWFNPELDADLKAELEKRKLTQGKFLDLGTGPGTQAHELAKLGFRVVGSDIAEAAIEKASAKYKGVEFVQDDILKTKIMSTFDYIFDRGCFHVFAPEKRAIYVDTVRKLLNPGVGMLFLKTFSSEQPAWENGPYRFSDKELRDIFGRKFSIVSTRKTVYQGTLEENPKAIFAVLKPL